MLAAAALRLAAVEALCPTAAAAPDGPWPTMARHRVYDSVMVAVDQLDGEKPFTPTLSVFTEDTRLTRRGPTATSVTGDARTDLVVIAELSIAAESEGESFADAMVEGDATARLALEALTAQVQSVLTRAPQSAGLRRIMKSVEEMRVEPFSLPQFGLRYLRNTITFTCAIASDKWTDEAGLPEPARSLAMDLPDGSYAKAKLAELAVLFAATSRDALASLDFAASLNGEPAITPVPSQPETTP